MDDKTVLKEMFTRNKIDWEESGGGSLVILKFLTVFSFKENGSLEAVMAFEGQNPPLDLSPREIEFLQAVDTLEVQEMDTTAADIAHELGCSDSTARQWLGRLVDKGALSTRYDWTQSALKRSWATFYETERKVAEFYTREV